jgi:tryptophan halogenase
MHRELHKNCYGDDSRIRVQVRVDKKIRVVILGGGTAGWMTASALSHFLSHERYTITLIESSTIGTVGVGEATIPHIRVFNQLLGINEQDFIAKTSATYKLGIRFRGWGDVDSDYYHPFGDHGFDMEGIPFHHCWMAAHKENSSGCQSFDQYSMANVMAHSERFSPPSPDISRPESTYSYAYHLDASSYAAFLKEFSLERNVAYVIDTVEKVEVNVKSGNIEKLLLASGNLIEGEFFVDCTGFSSQLLGKALNVKFTSWKDWLPCDRAIAVQTSAVEAPKPYTQSTATRAGWCWKIPLQTRVGNGHVYCSSFISDDEALATLRNQVTGEMLTAPKIIKFEAGMRECSWQKNCVAIGLSSGFLEPLESTSIYLIQTAIFKLLELFPVGDTFDVESMEFNRSLHNEYQKIRDFIILHYHLNTRKEPFWAYCATLQLPQSLTDKMDIFTKTGNVVSYEDGLFMPPSWLAVYLGQGKRFSVYDPRADYVAAIKNERIWKGMVEQLKTIADRSPTQAEIFEKNVKFSEAASPANSLYGARR